MPKSVGAKAILSTSVIILARQWLHTTGKVWLPINIHLVTLCLGRTIAIKDNRTVIPNNNKNSKDYLYSCFYYATQL